MKETILLIVISIFLFANNSNADRRFFGRSYTSYTLPSKTLELEIWNTGKFGKDSGYFYRWQPRLEFEYGVTDNLTASMYFNFDETRTSQNTLPKKSLSFSSTSFEIKYRLFDVGKYFIDPMLYSEIYFGGDKVKFEPKIILTKRSSRVIGVVNINFEIEKDIPASLTESKFEVTSGLAYEVSANFALGVELRNHVNFQDIYSSKKNEALYIGPTINIQTERFYLTLNAIGQVYGNPSTSNGLELKGHEKYEFRTILGINL